MRKEDHVVPCTSPLDFYVYQHPFGKSDGRRKSLRRMRGIAWESDVKRKTESEGAESANLSGMSGNVCLWLMSNFM